MTLHIKGMSLLISTSSCASLGDMRFHGLQDAILGHYNPPPYRHMRPRMWNPHFRLRHGSDTICQTMCLTDPSNDQLVLNFVLENYFEDVLFLVDWSFDICDEILDYWFLLFNIFFMDFSD